MILTLTEISERLKALDEVTLLETLGLTSEDIVNRFQDIIEDRVEQLEKLVDWE